MASSGPVLELARRTRWKMPSPSRRCRDARRLPVAQGRVDASRHAQPSRSGVRTLMLLIFSDRRIYLVDLTCAKQTGENTASRCTCRPRPRPCSSSRRHSGGSRTASFAFGRPRNTGPVLNDEMPGYTYPPGGSTTPPWTRCRPAVPRRWSGWNAAWCPAARRRLGDGRDLRALLVWTFARAVAHVVFLGGLRAGLSRSFAPVMSPVRVETDFVDITDLSSGGRRSARPTRIIYAETIVQPHHGSGRLRKLAEISHDAARAGG